MSDGEVAQLPEGWYAARLSQLLDIAYGKAMKAEDRAGGDVPVYGSNGIVGWHNEALCGPTIVIGRKGSVGEVNRSKVPCWPIDTTFYVAEFNAIDADFAYYGLKHLELGQHDASTAIPGISRDDVYAQTLYLPPLDEQRRIVAKIEALLARVHVTREHLARAPLILKRFRQSVLAAACNGQLTASWSETVKPESFLATVKQIAIDHAAVVPEIEAEQELNEGWIRVSLGFLARPTLRNRPYVTSGSRGWAKLVGQSGPYFIRSENINTDYLRLDDAVRVAAPAGAEFDRTRVQAADLLLTITGNNVGRVAVVPKDCPAAHVSQHVAIVRMHPSVLTDYVWLWMRSLEHGQKQLEGFFYGETKPGLNLEQVKSVWIDLPPLAEQREIVRRVDALFNLADAIERRVAAASQRTNKLTQAILAKAFHGDLVPTEADLARAEGRDYETAEQLLARIAATKAEPAKTTRKPRVIHKTVEHTIDIGQEVSMRTLNKDTVMAAVASMKTAEFTFDDLRKALPSDYEGLKQAIFELLQESDSGLSQRFDEATEQMTLVRRQK